MWRYYQRDVLDVHQGAMTWRQLRVLVEHLPPESATMTAFRNGLTDEQLAEAAEHGEPERARWSQVEQLLALLGDRLATIQHVLILANSDGKKRIEPPAPIRRPGAKPTKPKPKLAPASADWLFQMINGGAA